MSGLGRIMLGLGRANAISMHGAGGLPPAPLTIYYHVINSTPPPPQMIILIQWYRVLFRNLNLHTIVNYLPGLLYVYNKCRPRILPNLNFIM